MFLPKFFSNFSRVRLLVVHNQNNTHGLATDFALARLLTYLSCFKADEVTCDVFTSMDYQRVCEAQDNIDKLIIHHADSISGPASFRSIEREYGLDFRSYDFIIIFSLEGIADFPYPEKIRLFEKAFLSDFPFLPAFCFYKLDQPVLFGETSESPALKGMPTPFNAKNLDTFKTQKETILQHFKNVVRAVEKETDLLPVDDHLPLPLFSHPNYTDRLGCEMEEHFLKVQQSFGENSLTSFHRQSTGRTKSSQIWTHIEKILANINTAITVSGWCEVTDIREIRNLSVFVEGIEATIETPHFRKDLFSQEAIRIAWHANLNLFSCEITDLTKRPLFIEVVFKGTVFHSEKIKVGDAMSIKQKGQTTIFLESVFLRNDISMSSYGNALAKRIYLTGSKAVAMPLIAEHTSIESTHSRLDVCSGSQAAAQQLKRYTPTALKTLRFGLKSNSFLASKSFSEPTVF